MATQRVPSALGRLLRFVEENPDSTYADEALFEIGKCHKLMGNVAQARLSWVELQHRFPNSAWNGAARSELAAIANDSTEIIP